MILIYFTFYFFYRRNVDSEGVPQEVIELIQSGIDEALEEKAERTRLTAVHVKNIIKVVSFYLISIYLIYTLHDLKKLSSWYHLKIICQHCMEFNFFFLLFFLFFCSTRTQFAHLHSRELLNKDGWLPVKCAGGLSIHWPYLFFPSLD